MIIAVVTLAALTVGRVGFAAHHVRWIWPFAVFVHVSAAWAIASLVAARAAPARRPTVERAATAVALGAAALLTVLNLPALAQQQGPTVDADAIPVLHRVLPRLGALRAGAPVVFETANLRVFEPYSTAVMLDLQVRGIEFRVTDPSMVRQLGERRRADGTERTTIFQLEDAAALLYDGPACAIAVESGVDPEDAAAAGRDVDALAAGWQSGVVVDTSGLTVDEASAADAAGGGRPRRRPPARRAGRSRALVASRRGADRPRTGGGRRRRLGADHGLGARRLRAVRGRARRPRCAPAVELRRRRRAPACRRA